MKIGFAGLSHLGIISSIVAASKGFNVIPSAKATRLTMDREGIRKLVSEELGIPTSDYRFASNITEFKKSISDIGIPCVIKPVMSSSGRGQSIIKDKSQIEYAWEYAISGSRGESKKVIVESFIDFDYEITLLTIRQINGDTIYCNLFALKIHATIKMIIAAENRIKSTVKMRYNKSLKSTF